jgi:hypothetical protein
VTRRKLPVGDYGLEVDGRLVALVERKSLEKFLTDVHEIKGVHQQMSELGSHGHAAFVVEAQYADLGKPGRIGRWPAAHLLRVVGELAALHPSVPVVFPGNRKLANVWTQRFFAAVAAAVRVPIDDLVRDATLRFEPSAEGGTDERIRLAALEAGEEGFALAELAARFPGTPLLRIRRVLRGLVAAGRIRPGRGRGARWRVVPDL